MCVGGGGGRRGGCFKRICCIFYIEKREIVSFETQSILDILKSKFTPNYLYFKVTFLVPDNLLEQITV